MQFGLMGLAGRGGRFKLKEALNLGAACGGAAGPPRCYATVPGPDRAGPAIAGSGSGPRALSIAADPRLVID